MNFGCSCCHLHGIIESPSPETVLVSEMQICNVKNDIARNKSLVRYLLCPITYIAIPPSVCDCGFGVLKHPLKILPHAS